MRATCSPSSSTSAIELDQRHRRRASATGSGADQRTVELSTDGFYLDTSGDIGAAVGNAILDASIRIRLQELPKQIAREPATRPAEELSLMHHLNPTPTSIFRSWIQDPTSSADQTEVGTVLSVADGICRIHGLETCMSFEMLELPQRCHRPRPQPRIRQRRRGAVRRVGEDRRGRHGQADQAPARSPGRRGTAWEVVHPRNPLDGKGEILTTETRPSELKAPGVVQRQPVKEPMLTGLKAIDSMIPIGRGQRELSSAIARRARPPSQWTRSSTTRTATSFAFTLPSGSARRPLLRWPRRSRRGRAR